MTNEKFIQYIREIVRTELTNLNLLSGQWHLGKVTEVVSNKKLRVRVDGNELDQLMPCNPDVTFNVGDYVFVLYINGDSKTKFVPFKRAV